jgi:transposase InsO family protein
MSDCAKENDNQKYLLTAIDTFSKYAFASPVPDKNPKSVIKCLKEFFKTRKPKYIQSDKGGEFNNRQVKQFLKSEGVHYFVSQNEDIKCSIVERFNRTLKSKIYKYMTSKNTKRYVDVLPQITNAYNSTRHSQTKFRPIDVSVDNQEEVFRNLYNGQTLRDLLKQKAKAKLAVGDQVRISKHQDVFTKSYRPGWSEEVFKVDKVIRKGVPLFELEDSAGEKLIGRFYPQEVQKVLQTPETLFQIERILRSRKRQGTREYLVKWLGYPNSANSWIPASDLVDLQ